jgi:hypothetical protein
MKKNIHTYLFTLVVALLTLASATAQVSSNVSRLNIGKKKTTSLVGALKPTLYATYPSTSDRSIKLRSSAAISAYYRAKLPAVAAASNVPTVAKTRSNPEIASVFTPEIRNAGSDEAQSEDFFFVGDKLKVRNAFPNPASDYAEIYYQLEHTTTNAKIVIYNAILANVGEYELDRSERQLRLPTRDLPTGVYFYQLQLDGKKVATKKLLVRH